MEGILRRTINDASDRVREKAAEASDRLNLKRLLPQLRDRLSVETKSKLRKRLAFHCAMLEDGYVVETEARAKEKILAIRLPDGGWSWQPIKRSDCNERRIKEIIAAQVGTRSK